MMRRWVWLGLLVILIVTTTGSGLTQNDSWSEPRNLSHSGAAEQPRLVVGANGAVQVFWRDIFDGLTTAYANGGDWTQGVSIPLDLVEGQMPEFVVDTSNWIHAFWLSHGSSQELWHASMRMGDSNWTVTELLATSVLDFKAFPLTDGAITTAYLRIAEDWGAPAGVFFRRLEPGTIVWNDAISLDTSAYYRLATENTNWLHLATYDDNLMIMWLNPHNGEYLATTSANGGWNWVEPSVLTPPTVGMEKPRAILSEDAPIVIWQNPSGTGCVLLQQVVNADWQSIFGGLRECPQNDLTWNADSKIYWLWGQGKNVLSLAAWDGESWTMPLEIAFDFPDTTNGISENLQDLQFNQSANRLYIVGSDNQGEVWFLESVLSALALLEAPKQPWSPVTQLSTDGFSAGEPTLAVDVNGSFHVVWAEALPGSVFNALTYNLVEDYTIGQPVRVKTGQEGQFMRQPLILADQEGWLHLVWSGGEYGELFYSRVHIGEANNPGAWSPDMIISDTASAWPQLVVDPLNRLYLLYAVPINEGRGIYLSRSIDDGDSWTTPEQVFSAQAAEWQGVGPTALVIGPGSDGERTVTLHAVWVEESLAGTLPSRGIWYSRAITGIDSIDPLFWSEPFLVAEEGANWPHLVVLSGHVHLVYALTGQGIYERHIPLDSTSLDVGGWSTASQVPDWTAPKSIDGYPFGVSSSGNAEMEPGVLHLIGMPETGELEYRFLENDRWWETQDNPLFSRGHGSVEWIDQAGLPSGVRLGIVWTGRDENGLPGVFWSSRDIPQMDVIPLPTISPLSIESTVIPSEPEATPLISSPTPDLNQVPRANMSSVTPLIVGGGLAGLLVVGFMLVMRRKR